MLGRFATQRLLQIRQIPQTSLSFSTALNDRIDSPDSNPDLPWEFNDKNKEKVKELLSHYPSICSHSSAGSCTAATWRVASCVSNECSGKGYRGCSNLTEGLWPEWYYPTHDNHEVEGSSLGMLKKGGLENTILVCGTTPCMIHGSREIEDALLKHLGVKRNEVTKDGLFSVGEMECMEDITPKRVVEIVEALRKGEKPPHGTQNPKCINSGPEGGNTTLLCEHKPPPCRDLDAC